MGTGYTVEQRRERARELGILVDPEDEHFIDEYTWRISTKGYVETNVDNRTIKLHHLIVGKPPIGMQVDHENRNKRDNRRHNLPFKTAHDNQHNTDRLETAKNIREKNGRFEVRLRRFDMEFYASCRTLEEAQERRREFLDQSQEYRTIVETRNGS